MVVLVRPKVAGVAIRRRIYTTTQNGYFGVTVPNLIAATPLSPFRASLWPPQNGSGVVVAPTGYVTQGFFDRELGLPLDSTATAAADTANGAPFLNDIVVPPIAAGQTVNIQLSSQDAEAQSVVYEATRRGSVDYQFNVNATTGVLSVTAPTNFTGAFELTAGVRSTDQSSVTTGDKFDTQVLRFNVSAATLAPTSVDLAAVSDSGTSDSDNVTNAATMQFVVAGTTAVAL